jgi:hypothetical protein
MGHRGLLEWAADVRREPVPSTGCRWPLSSVDVSGTSRTPERLTAKWHLKRVASRAEPKFLDVPPDRMRTKRVLRRFHRAQLGKIRRQRNRCNFKQSGEVQIK